MGLSGASELYGNSLAREIAPVRLTGNYGGELLRGARAFKYQVPKGGFITPDFQPYLEEAKNTFQDLEMTDPVTFALFRQAPLQGYGRLAIEKSQIIMRTPFMDNDLVKLVYQSPPHLLKSEELSVAIISRYNPDLLKIPTDRGLLGGGSWLEGRIRQFHREMLFKSEYIASHGMPDWLATISRFGISEILSKSFLGRHKFQHFRLWSQKYFAGYITDVLLKGLDDLGDFFVRRNVEDMVSAHLSGTQNYIDEIDKLLTLTLAYGNLLKRTP
jgi:asparagine synthase (glutamine-hydrolysing)